MSEDDQKPARYHLPLDFALDPGERVFIERFDAEASRWAYHSNVPETARTPALLQSLLRELAFAQGGEGWRAMTERDEALRRFTVYDFAKELNGNKPITLSPKDQNVLGFARMRLSLPSPC